MVHDGNAERQVEALVPVREDLLVAELVEAALGKVLSGGLDHGPADIHPGKPGLGRIEARRPASDPDTDLEDVERDLLGLGPARRGELGKERRRLNPVNGLVEPRAVVDAADRAVRRASGQGVAALGPVPIGLVVTIPESGVERRLRLQRGRNLRRRVLRTVFFDLDALALRPVVPPAQILPQARVPDRDPVEEAEPREGRLAEDRSKEPGIELRGEQ